MSDQTKLDLENCNAVDLFKKKMTTEFFFYVAWTTIHRLHAILYNKITLQTRHLLT